jgi:hypothetical protein
MTEYLLFIYGNYRNGDDKVAVLAELLSPIVDSNNLKFNYGDYNIIFHFKTSFIFNELEEFMGLTVTPFCDQYFLIEVTEKLSVNMPESLYKNLFDFDFINHDFNLDTRYFSPEKIGIGGNVDDFLLSLQPYPGTIIDDEIELSHEDKLNLILEKINKDGIQSLTNEERKFLNQNSK